MPIAPIRIINNTRPSMPSVCFVLSLVATVMCRLAMAEIGARIRPSFQLLISYVSLNARTPESLEN